ncbi:PREDICTED: phytochrome A-associated F-box protein [Tarenaya hassleriana]|uniref:phytochrome A-associated F-box protein n=1 Tax=Tarenaya hassleriana TaxID=28532 RepID=UPI00053C1D69|nr:PREDICTED: phytochrome A-associated F-box protein [Tarenaya hassleriana]
MAESAFSVLSEDLILNIFSKLQDDPRNWARLACVCTRFSSIVRTICWKSHCYATIPSVVSDLLSSPSAATSSSADPPLLGGWASLHKLAVSCPGLLHAGVLLENSDFGLERELGPDESLRLPDPKSAPADPTRSDCGNPESGGSGLQTSSIWSLYDDLYYDTLPASPEYTAADCDEVVGETDAGEIRPGQDVSQKKRRKIWRSIGSHLSSGAWNLSREPGNKLLASRFRDDCLYICDWPGCIHVEEKRSYMLFRGVFKNFKHSRVWRTINDGNRRKIALKCAFCTCNETWDLHSAFCLRRVFGFHDDGEPVVRAYVCENGHVSGAWTTLPLYT